MDPPIRPKPRNAIRSGRAAAAPLRIRVRSTATLTVVGPSAQNVRLSSRRRWAWRRSEPRRSTPLGGPGTSGGILPALVLPSVLDAALLPEHAAAARAARLLGEERLEGRSRVDDAAADSTGEGRHRVEEPAPVRASIVARVSRRGVPRGAASYRAGPPPRKLRKSMKLSTRNRTSRPSAACSRARAATGPSRRPSVRPIVR